MTRSRNWADPGANRQRVLGAGVDEAIREANAISAAVRAEMAAAGARVMPVRDPRWPSKVRRVPKAELASLGYQPPRSRPSKPPGPAAAPDVARREARMAAAAADALAGKRTRAKARLAAINEAWERRGRR